MIRNLIIILFISSSLCFSAQQSSQTGDNIPKGFSLSQNYPNPFNPSTKIRFDIGSNGNVKLVIFDLLGRNIKTLLNEYRNAGSHEVTFNAADLPGGLYFYKISSGNYSEMKRMILLK